MKSVAIVLALLPLAASAATITVNTVRDNTIAGNGQCTLREAIANVNAAADTTSGDCTPGSGTGDTITFSLRVPATIQRDPTLGELTVERDVNIAGPANAMLRISGAGKTRVFEIAAGTTQVSDVTIWRGNADHAGGVLVDSGATLNLTHCTLSGNQAKGGGGGGLSNAGGTVTLTNSTFNGNQARSGNGGGVHNEGMITLTTCIFNRNLAYPGDGGGIENGGTLTLSNCTFRGNHARSGGGGAIDSRGTATLTNCTVKGNQAGVDGGGIGNSGTVTIGNSTVSGNHAGINGGGLVNSGTATLTNSTVSGNHAGSDVAVGDGGGIENSGSATLANCTVAENSAVHGGGGINNTAATSIPLTNCTVIRNHAGARYYGGGIYGPATFTSTILTINDTGARRYDENCSGLGACADGGHNLDSDGTCHLSGNGCIFCGHNGSSLCFRQVNWAPLSDNGGPTQTIALLPGSPAIDAGDDSVTGPPDNLTTDQRGLPRLSGAHVDIGAYEVQ